MGRLAMPSLIAQAVAPSLGALLMEVAGISLTPPRLSSNSSSPLNGPTCP